MFVFKILKCGTYLGLILFLAGCEQDPFPTHDSVKTNSNPNIPSQPSPANMTSEIDTFLFLDWTAGDPDPEDNIIFELYLDTVSPPQVRIDDSSLKASGFYIEGLSYKKNYYWNVVSNDTAGNSFKGAVWSFSTHARKNLPINPFPVHLSSNNGFDFIARWELEGQIPDTTATGYLNGFAKDSLFFDIFLDTEPPTLQVPDTINISSLLQNDATGLLDSATLIDSFNILFGFRDSALAFYDVQDGFVPFMGLTRNTTYYWQVLVRDSSASNLEFISDLWKFNTAIEIESPENMVLIKTVPFRMGDTLGEGTIDELPVHTVDFKRPFWMDLTEITNFQFARFDTAYNNLAISNPEDPVANVKWQKVIDYCNWRSDLENLDHAYSTYKLLLEKNGYRLPTEAEWEFAARGGLVGKRYSWGDTFYGSVNYLDNSPNGGEVWPVKQSSVNGYGLFGMTGNVAEWCDDDYMNTWYQDYIPGNYQYGPTSLQGFRVVRGGNYYTDKINLKVSNRDFENETHRDAGLGFRCVRHLE